MPTCACCEDVQEFDKFLAGAVSDHITPQVTCPDCEEDLSHEDVMAFATSDVLVKYSTPFATRQLRKTDMLHHI